VLLAPVTRSAAVAALGRLRLAPVLAGTRGQPPADMEAIADAITGLSRLAGDLGDALEALDINPLICAPTGAIAADALLVPRSPPGFQDHEQFRALFLRSHNSFPAGPCVSFPASPCVPFPASPCVPFPAGPCFGPGHCLRPRPAAATAFPHAP
jgi:hypothetical protein